LPNGSTLSDVTRIGDGTGADATARSRWRRPRTWLELAVLLAAAVVIANNAPFVISRAREAKRLHHDGVVVSGVIEQRDRLGRYGSQVRVSYDYGGRSYGSWVVCYSSSLCSRNDVLELWVDPQRPDRFATEEREINDGTEADQRWMWMYIFGALALAALISLLTSKSEDPGRQARRRQARRRAS
jgi:hypothetical protein